MKLLLFVSCIALSACGRAPNIDPVFLPYLNKFQSEADKYNKPIDISFDIQLVENPSPDPQVVGACEEEEGIVIKRAFWVSTDDIYREILLFHELGHCALHLGHVKTASIMYPMLLNSYYYLSNRDALVKELFTGARDIP